MVIFITHRLLLFIMFIVPRDTIAGSVNGIGSAVRGIVSLKVIESGLETKSGGGGRERVDLWSRCRRIVTMVTYTEGTGGK